MDPRFLAILRSQEMFHKWSMLSFGVEISTLNKTIQNTPQTYFHLQGIEERWGSFFANLNSWFIIGRISLLLLKTMMGRCQATSQQLHLRLDMLINPIKIEYPSFNIFQIWRSPTLAVSLFWSLHWFWFWNSLQLQIEAQTWESLCGMDSWIPAPTGSSGSPCIYIISFSHLGAWNLALNFDCFLLYICHPKLNC